MRRDLHPARQLWSALAASALLVGCAEERPTADPDAVCDGGDGLALAFAIWPAGNIGTEEMFVMRNGFSYLYLDRSCTYWTNVMPARNGFQSRTLQHTRTGTLTRDQLTELLADVRYAEWGEMQGPPPPTNVFDAPMEAVTDGTRAVQCVYRCRRDGRSVKPERTEVVEAAIDWISRVGQLPDSRPMSGQVGVMVMYYDEPSAYQGPTAEWPLERLIADFVGTGENPVVTVVEPPDANLLRDLRERQARGELAEWWSGQPELPILVPGRAEIFKLTVNDVLPFEDPEGGIPIWNALQ